MANEHQDKRSVSTDALETLGMVHEREEQRDAIHLAVVPVEAHEDLAPGNHVVAPSGKAWRVLPGEGIGIVDPFLDRPVRAGERFWLVIYPRKITSLRHVWSHPDVPEELPPTSPDPPSREVREATLQIRDMAADLECSVETLMEGASVFLQSGEALWFGHDLDYSWDADKFWRCYETVTGKVVADKQFFFRCSC